MKSVAASGSARAHSRRAGSVANLVSTAAFYDVFPLDFSRIGLAWVGSLVHVLLLVVIVGISIAVVVHAVRLLFGRRD